MAKLIAVVFSIVIASASITCAGNEELTSSCDVRAETESGMVCGRIRNATDGTKYASFRGIRYAKAPRGQLRFARPEKPDPWEGIYDATEHGPVCHQFDPVFGPMFQPVSMDEDCLSINVHAPASNFPTPNKTTIGRTLPVLAWIHGGAFSYGSGDSDMHGPEYLMASEDIVVVTFNYRINVFGFLSLGTEQIPGNAGLWDAVLALEWIQKNIANFGGDPDDVTVGGQSAGAAMSHILSISPIIIERNLFKKVMCFSGTAISNFFSPHPNFVRLVRRLFFIAAQINIIQSQDGIYRDLIEAPIDRLMRANKFLLDLFGFAAFGPVIENSELNITAIIPKDPEILMNEGFGKEFPMLLGFTDNECATGRDRLIEASFETKLRLSPSITVPLNLLFTSNSFTVRVLTGKMLFEYFNVIFITLDNFLPACSDSFFRYPTMRVVRKRVATGAEDTFVHQFVYPGEKSVIKQVMNSNWTGAGHLEDQTYFFRVNSILGPNSVNELNQDDEDSKMRQFMTESVVRFVRTGRPATAPLLGRNLWPATGEDLRLLNIEYPQQYNFTELSPDLMETLDFFDSMYTIAGKNSEELWTKN